MTSISRIEVCRLNDFILEHDRKNKKRRNEDVSESISFTIYHNLVSTIDDVGLQLWKGAFLLSEYLIFNRISIQNHIVVELGAGCGFCGVVLSQLETKCCFITDCKVELLQIISDNISCNAHLNKNGIWGKYPIASNTRIKLLDWCELGTPLPLIMSVDDPFRWNDNDLAELEHSRRIFIAADVIYDDILTESFFLKLSQLIQVGERVIMTIEKRINFSFTNQSICATGYALFLSIINALEDGHQQIQFSKFIAQFKGVKLEYKAIPHYFNCYERTGELELWEVTCVK